MPQGGRKSRIGPALALVLVLLSPAAAHGQGSDESDLGVAILKEARALAGRGELEEALEKTTRALSFARAEHGAYDALVGFILDDLATLNYRLRDWLWLRAGYRHLEVDYEDGDFSYDVEMSGPIVGAGMRF